MTTIQPTEKIITLRKQLVEAYRKALANSKVNPSNVVGFRAADMTIIASITEHLKSLGDDFQNQSILTGVTMHREFDYTQPLNHRAVEREAVMARLQAKRNSR